MKVLTDFAGQNWLITPVALAVGEPPPANIHEQQFLLILSGVVFANLQGNSGSQWLRETLSFLPDMAGPQNSGPLNWAIQRFGIPKPAGNSKIAFSLEEWAPFASLSSIFNQDQSINSGFAVDVWRPTHFATGIDAFTHAPVGNIFTGINVDVAVRDTDAFLFRVGYNISLLGKIVFLVIPKVLFQSNFDQTPIGNPPSTVQQVGTAKVEGPPRSVVVAGPPLPGPHRWVRINRPAGPDIASFIGLLTEAGQPGVYNFGADIIMPTGAQVSSISFESPAQSFLHLDFMPDNKVRLDDVSVTEFGTFARDQPFHVDVKLTVAAQSTAQITLSGAASGATNYTLQPPFQGPAHGFSQIRVWQGFTLSPPITGAFDATNIVVSREG
jgi:hypothetical protein